MEKTFIFDATIHTIIGLHADYTKTELTISATIGGIVVTNIGDNAFNEKTTLQKVSIPSSVTSIGDGAFGYCSNLSSVWVEASTPPMLSITVLGVDLFILTLIADGNGSIKVPPASVSAYQGASGWSSYSSKISGY